MYSYTCERHASVSLFASPRECTRTLFEAGLNHATGILHGQVYVNRRLPLPQPDRVKKESENYGLQRADNLN